MNFIYYLTTKIHFLSIYADFPGCYKLSVNLTADLSGYNMEITQCRQICMARSAEYAMINYENCFCTNETEVSQLEQQDFSVCQRTCAGRYQNCGEAGHVNVHKLGENSIKDILLFLLHVPFNWWVWIVSNWYIICKYQMFLTRNI